MIVIEKDVKVSMADGARPAADVFLLDGPPSPVLLVRTPYGKDQNLGGMQWLPTRQNPPALKAMSPTVTFSDVHER